MSTYNIPFFNMKKKNTRNYLKSAAMDFFSKRLKNEFERAMVNEPSVFEPLKFYCNVYFGDPSPIYTVKNPQILR